MLGKFIAGHFIAIAGEMRRFLASNENTVRLCTILHASGFGLLPNFADCIMYRDKNHNYIIFVLSILSQDIP
jgi:hypothetical protein